MSLPDTNAIIYKYLSTASAETNPLLALVKAGGVTRIYCPRAPENAVLPNVTYFTRGGASTPYSPDIPSPSVQFDCWADSLITARNVYRTLYDALQGIQNVKVTIGVTDYYILGAREEVQGVDLVDVDIPGRFRVLTFFEFMIR
jgi:hypothetical protein